MQVTTIGLDLAKNVFQMHGITENEVVVFDRPFAASQKIGKEGSFRTLAAQNTNGRSKSLIQN